MTSMNCSSIDCDDNSSTSSTSQLHELKMAWLNINIDVDNSTYVDPYWFQFPPIHFDWQILTMIFMFVTSILSILGNGLVLIVCLKFNKLVLSNIFIINLAIADIANPIATYWMLIVSSYKQFWFFGETGCSLYGFMHGYFGIMSLVTVSAYALCICTVGHFQRNRQHFQLTVLALIWLYCGLLTFPPLLGWSSYGPAGFLTTCCFDYISRDFKTQSFIIYLFVFGFIVPLVVLIVSFFVVFQRVRWYTRNYESFNVSRQIYKNANRSKSSDKRFISKNRKRNRKLWCLSSDRFLRQMKKSPSFRQRFRRERRYNRLVVKVMLTVLTTFLVAWGPYALVALLGQYGPRNIITPLIATIPAIFAKTSTVYNPFIYAYQDKHFRTASIQTLMFR